MAGFAENKFRITYRSVEAVDQVGEIRHPVIRETLRLLGYDDPLNIAIISDIPGNSGLGSSSSFTVGFIRLIEHLLKREITKFDLMKLAVQVEHDILQENVGIQDHIHASFGGLSLYNFQGSSLSIRPVQIRSPCRLELNESLCLVFTGIQRSASKTLEEQMNRTREKKIHKELSHLVELSEHGLKVLEGASTESALKEFGALISEGWETKKALSGAISNEEINEIYDFGMKSGAYGGKLCGAGGGGFFLFLAPPHVQTKLIGRFGQKNFVKIRMEDGGATIISK